MLMNRSPCGTVQEDCEDLEGRDPGTTNQGNHPGSHWQQSRKQILGEGPKPESVTDVAHAPARYPHHRIGEHQSCQEGCPGEVLWR